MVVFIFILPKPLLGTSLWPRVRGVLWEANHLYLARGGVAERVSIKVRNVLWLDSHDPATRRLGLEVFVWVQLEPAAHDIPKNFCKRAIQCKSRNRAPTWRAVGLDGILVGVRLRDLVAGVEDGRAVQNRRSGVTLITLAVVKYKKVTSGGAVARTVWQRSGMV